MSIPRTWRSRQQRYSLKGERCENCHNAIFPAARRVPALCGAAQKEFDDLSGRGNVYSYTTIYNPPAGFEEYAPYTVALVKLDDGPMVTAQLTDVAPSEVRSGCRWRWSPAS